MSKFQPYINKIKPIFSKFERGIAKAHILTRKRWIKWPLILGCMVVLFFTGLYFSIFFGAFGHVPSSEELRDIRNEQSTQVLDRNGQLIGKFYIYDRQPSEFKDFPKHLVDALVSTEDTRFFEHRGIDNVSLARVFVKTILMQDKSSGGGSTITLQLAKNLYGRKHYPVLGIVVNKFKEAIIANRLERNYTKEEILEMYLNTVPFPDNTFGIESASRRFFNKSVSDLTVDESALLIGSLKANTYYNPRTNTERSVERRNVVLSQMAKYNYIPSDSLESYMAREPQFNFRSFNQNDGIAPYFRQHVKRELASILDTLKSPTGRPYDLYKDGLIVHTTLDYTMQSYAEASMEEHLSKLQKDFERSYGKWAPWFRDKKLLEPLIKIMPQYKMYKERGLSEEQIKDSLNVKRDIQLWSWENDTIRKASAMDSLRNYLKLLNTGMVSIEPSSGAIRSYIGGINYNYFKYDHVSQAERQVGSTFKPIVYTTAIESGMDPCNYYEAKPVKYPEYNNWMPKNSGGMGEEEDSLSEYSLKYALSRSVNTVAVKLINDVGITRSIEQANTMGISKAIPKEPSIALGTAQITMLDMAKAYTTYVNNGKFVQPYSISKILDRRGNVLVSIEAKQSKKPAFREYTRQVMLEMMKETVNSGTASRLRYTYGVRNDVAGKTGTTQDNKDGWFVGLTPSLVTLTWVGNDNHAIGFRSTSQGQGANSALPMFAKFYQKLNNDKNYDSITSAKFDSPWKQVREDLECANVIRPLPENFFDKIFGRKTPRYEELEDESK
ncbi:transglycosylase domain-containing protein [Winogradskyella maritima]|uniref:Transglycosylase domain-containing protein n=1 Tax=Winogradskyella maritima TaxID=1517766 RepID=A0ABV8AE48_9FLAO|nr:transglycosylase domain-containing protein [Winogradskyella maritima]